MPQIASGERQNLGDDQGFLVDIIGVRYSQVILFGRSLGNLSFESQGRFKRKRPTGQHTKKSGCNVIY
jgi:hypothetical protein